MVANKQNWSAALRTGGPTGRGMGVEEMKRRYRAAASEFTGLVKGIKDRGESDAGFVDALCDPPESFTYGGALAHIATFSAYRRTMAVIAFRQLGVIYGLATPSSGSVPWPESTCFIMGCDG